MPSKSKKTKTPPNYGNPDEEPDFDYEHVQDRIRAFLRDSRAGGGGAGLVYNTLIMRRLRSAIQHVHDGLRESTDVTHGLFGWGWFLLRKMLVRCLALHAGHDLTVSS